MAELQGKKRRQPSSCPEGWLPAAMVVQLELTCRDVWTLKRKIPAVGFIVFAAVLTVAVMLSASAAMPVLAHQPDGVGPSHSELADPPCPHGHEDICETITEYGFPPPKWYSFPPPLYLGLAADSSLSDKPYRVR